MSDSVKVTLSQVSSEVFASRGKDGAGETHAPYEADAEGAQAAGAASRHFQHYGPSRWFAPDPALAHSAATELGGHNMNPQPATAPVEGHAVAGEVAAGVTTAAIAAPLSSASGSAPRTAAPLSGRQRTAARSAQEPQPTGTGAAQPSPAVHVDPAAPDAEAVSHGLGTAAAAPDTRSSRGPPPSAGGAAPSASASPSTSAAGPPAPAPSTLTSTAATNGATSSTAAPALEEQFPPATTAGAVAPPPRPTFRNGGHGSASSFTAAGLRDGGSNGAGASAAPAPTTTAATAVAAASPSASGAEGAESYVRPAVALSSRLLDLYKMVNARYCAQRRLESPGPKYNSGYDDKDGHYLFLPGEVIFQRYIAQEVLGKGSFGTVIRGFDQKRSEAVAMKITRRGSSFRSQAKLELDILLRLNENPALNHLVVRLLKVFEWQGHLVLVFELLSFNLYQLIKCTRFNGVSLDLVRKFAYQLTHTLLQLESQKPHPIIHCDLKPENILLRNQNRSGIRLIDFGSACYTAKRFHRYIQSRFYRSPEVILFLEYGTPIDRWSLACVLVELHTGVPLFDGRTEAAQLAKFEATLGSIPAEMVAGSPKANRFYYGTLASDFQLKEPVPERRSLESIIGVTTGGPRGRRLDTPGHDEKSYREFYDFIARFLRYVPEERMSCRDALQHPFLMPLYTSDLQQQQERGGGAAPAAAPPPAGAPGPKQLQSQPQYRPSSGQMPATGLSGGAAGGGGPPAPPSAPPPAPPPPLPPGSAGAFTGGAERGRTAAVAQGKASP